MTLETLELRCAAEVQRLESSDSLSQDQTETLNSIREEVLACQRYLDYVQTSDENLEVLRSISFPEIARRINGRSAR